MDFQHRTVSYYQLFHNELLVDIFVGYWSVLFLVHLHVKPLILTFSVHFKNLVKTCNILDLYFEFLPPANEFRGQVMIIHLSVILFTGVGLASQHASQITWLGGSASREGLLPGGGVHPGIGLSLEGSASRGRGLHPGEGSLYPGEKVSIQRGDCIQ